MEARLAWCEVRQSAKSLYGAETTTVHVHIDEKNFYAFKTKKVLYMPPGVEPPAQEVQSKTKIPSVMFLAAIGYPRYASDTEWWCLTTSIGQITTLMAPLVSGQS